VPINAVPMTVEMAFGFAPGSGTPAPGDWVDVTPYLDVTPNSTGVVASSGRDAVRSGIRSGSLSFTLENKDGRFNPRNASGPYYGDLRNGTPVRVTTGAGGDLTVGTPVAGPAGTGPDALSGPALGTIDPLGAGWIENPSLTEGGTYADREVVIPVTPPAAGTSVAVSATFETIAGTVDSSDNMSTSNNIAVVAFENNPATSGYFGNPILGIEYLPVGERTVGTITTLTFTFTADTTCWVALVAPTVDPSELGVQLGWNITATIEAYSPRWLGFVDSGWPQTITSRYPTVTISAHDILGLLAQNEAPFTAWDALLREYSPDHVWRPGADGWIDSVTGHVMRHTSQLVQLDDDPIIDGAEKPWGQVDTDGKGQSTDPADRVVTTGESLTILARIKLPTIAERTVGGVAEAICIIDQGEVSGFSPVRVTIYPEWLEILTTDATGIRQAFTVEAESAARLMDGEPHTLMVHIPDGAPVGFQILYAWVDGREVTLSQVATPGTYSLTSTDLYIGGTSPAVIGGRAYSGAIDPLVIWRDFVGGFGAIDALAVEAHAAATAPWSGQRLDERVTSIVTAMDLGNYLGAMDTSGIVTQQGYRQRPTLELLQTIEDTEQGRIWVDREGCLRFSRRSWAWDDTVSNTVQVTFSDDPTLIAGGAQEMLERGTEITDDPLNIVGVASVTSTNGRTQTVEDPASVALYGRRNAVQLSNLLHPSDRQSRAIAEWLVLSQGTPQIQARQVSFRVEDNPTVLAPLAAQIEEGWLVRIRKLTTADTLDLYAHVIGIEHEWDFTGWYVTLTLDATRTGYSFFKWGTSTWGGSAGWSF
jgi:hypothetical protein